MSSDSDDIVVTLEEDGEESYRSLCAVDEVSPAIHPGKARVAGIPIPLKRSEGTRSEDDHSARFSSSPTTDDDESGSGTRSRSSNNNSNSGSEISGGGTPGRKASLASDGVEARVFASEAEHKAYKRMKALEEIIETERAYVKSLEIVNKYYLQPLKKILTPDEIGQIFINLPTLLTVNKTLLAQLEERYLLGSDCCLGDVFLTTADYLKFYTTYTIKHTDALVVVRQLKQRNVYFGPFLKKMQMEPQCQNTYLTSFLIKPVQRICKYPLLIRELIKYTPEGHKDLEDLRAALDKVNSVAEHLNKHHLKAQNISKMMEIQYSLTGIGKRTLLEPRRVFKVEADLNLSKSLHRKGVRKFFLFNDLLIIAKIKKEYRQKEKEDQQGDGSHSPRKGIYEVKVWLPLTLVLIRDIEDTPATKNVFELWEEKDTTVKEAKKAKSKSWVVYAKSPEEKAKWISSIEKYKRKLEAENEPASPDDNGNGKTVDTSKSLKMPRSKSSRQLQRGTLKIISLDVKQDKSASLGSSGMSSQPSPSSSDFPPWNRPSPALLTRVEPRRGTVGEIAQHSKVKTNREVTQEGELGLSPRGRGLSTKESPAARKGIDLNIHSQPVPSPASSPALLGATNGSRFSALSGSHQSLPGSNWVSSSPGSSTFAPLSSSSVASPPESPRSGFGLGGSAVSAGIGTSPAPRRKSRRLSAATPMSPSGAHGGLIVPTSGSLSANNLPSTPTSRRFRLFGGGKASDSEEDNIGPSKASPTATSALQAQLSARGDGDADSGGEEESAEGSGSSRRRGLSFTRRSKRTEVSKVQDDSEEEKEKEREKEKEKEKDNRASKMKRSGSFVVLSSRLDKKTGESGRKLSGKDDSETKPASGSGKVRKRSEGDAAAAAAAKAPLSFGSEGLGSLDEDDNDEH